MRKGLLGIVVAYGAAVALLSLPIAGLTLLGLGLGPQGNWLAAATTSLSIVAAGAGVGLALAWAGWSDLRSKPTPALQLPSAWLSLLLFAAILLAGQFVLHTPLAPALLPPIHVLASLLPALFLLAAVLGPLQRAGAELTLRDLALQSGYGALVATLLAILAEIAAIVGATLWSGLVLSFLPGGSRALERLADVLLTPDIATNPQSLAGLLRSPALVLAGALLVAVLAPALEEIFKSLGIWLDGEGPAGLKRARVFALGVMAGVGFSYVEGLFYGAMGLPDAWAGQVLVRASTVLIHGLATGLMALGWYALQARQRWQAGAFLLAGIGLHSLWNAIGGLTTLVSLTNAQSASPSAGALGLGLVTVGLLAMLFLASTAILAWLIRELAK